MAIVRVPDRFAARRGLAAAATALNEVLLDGEFFLEKDTRRIKQGDGVTAYNSLPYAVAGPFDVTGLADGDTWVWDSGAGMFVPGTPEIDVNDLIGFPGGTSDFLRSDGTFASPGGGGGAAAGYSTMRLKSGSSLFRATSDYGGTPTQVLPAAANRMYAQPFTVDRAITISAIGGENTSNNATVGAKFRVAIYDNAVVGGFDQPGTLLAQSADLPVNVGGVKTTAISLALSPGVIYWSVHINNIGVQYRCYDFNLFPVQWFGRSTTTTNQPITHVISNAAGLGWSALPSTWSGTYTSASSNVPAVFLVE